MRLPHLAFTGIKSLVANEVPERPLSRVLRWIAIILIVLIAGAGVAAAAIPGPQRAFCAQCFGLKDIGNNVFTDAPGDSEALSWLVSASDSRVAEFYGTLQAHPRYVICMTEDCYRRFGGSTAKATSFGAEIIRVGPNGLNATILAHERMHTELAARLGWYGMLASSVPAWFNEGLAVYWSNDSRYHDLSTVQEETLTRTAVTPGDWLKLLHEYPALPAYQAARNMVADIAATIGTDGLRALVDETTKGADFDQVLERLVTGAD